MRFAEWINLVYFLFLVGVAFVRPPPRVQTQRILMLGGIGLLATLGGRVSDMFLAEEISRPLRDWLPAPTLLVAYWAAGHFYTEPSVKLQAWLESIDDRLSASLGRFRRLTEPSGSAIYLEAVYLLAYPLVPVGLGVLFLFGMSDQADRFWSIVLAASYSCYVVLPFAPTLPPRFTHRPGRHTPDLALAPIRRLNEWILSHFGIGANTFPSGHVAATLATSCLVLEANPWVGGLFLWLSVSIAISAVAERYHFAIDIVLGALLAVGSWVLLG